MEGENLLNNPYEDITGDGQVMPNSEVHLSEETVTIDALDEENDDDLYTQGFVPGKNYGNERVQKAGKFLLTMKYICGVSQLHMPTVIEEAEALFEFVFDETAKKFSQLGYLPPGADVRSVKTEVCSVFDGLKTKHSQEKYLRESHEVTQPRYVTLDSKFQKVGEGRKRRVEIAEKNFVYIPIQEVVEKLVRHPDYPKLTERKCNPDPNVLDCYLKGDFAKKNPVLKEHPDALRFKTFYDDAEFCKDLSSRSSNNQKLGCFYMTLDNIDPKYQGNLDTMWLVALVNASFVKEHGLDFVLDRAVVDLKKFEEGVVINGKKTYGTLIAVEGDNLGLNFLGGFKCGFTATCPCRRCTMELGDIRAGKKVTQEQLRTPAQYDQHVEELESARTAKDRDQKSTKFGVNKGCVLNKLSSYHVVEGLPPDSLHDSLEGLLSRGVKNIINHCMDLNLMSLTWLNSAIKDFDYGYSEKTVKPSPLRDDHLKEDGKLHQSASQLWCLATILPLILGDLVDVEDEKWEHFLTILEINRIVFSSEINKSQLPYLSSLISAYFEGHIKFYGDLKPKDHFLSHYPDAWLQFGSIIDFTCFHGEANHQVLKRIMSLTGNYKNILTAKTEERDASL